MVDVRAARGFGRHSAMLRRAARSALQFVGAVGELSISLVGDDEIQALNRDWRGRDRPTDVLAFAQQEGEGDPVPGLLGDVVISVPTAARQAALRGVDLDRELRALLVHGLLHLLGHDHERSRSEARHMFTRARATLKALGDAAGPRGLPRLPGSPERRVARSRRPGRTRRTES